MESNLTFLIIIKNVNGDFFLDNRSLLTDFRIVDLLIMSWSRSRLIGDYQTLRFVVIEISIEKMIILNSNPVMNPSSSLSPFE